MNVKQITMGVVATIVAIVIVVTCAIPIISDSVNPDDKLTNDGWTRVTKYGTDAEVTVFWDHTKPHQVTVNGTDIELPIGGGNNNEFSMTILGTPEFLLRYRSTNENVGGLSFYNSTGGYHAGTNDGTDLLATISNGSITVDNSVNTPETQSYTDYLFVVSKDTGEYVMKKPTVNSYLKGDSEIYGIGRSQVGTSFYSIVMLGTIDDGVNVEVVHANPPTISDATIVYSELTSHIDLYAFDKITMTASSGGTDYPLVYNQVIVPYEVTAEKSIHADGPTTDIISVIPVMMVLGIVIGAIALFITTKRD